MTNKILTFYEEYKKYMDLQDNIFPELTPVLEEDNIINTLAHINTDEMTSKNVNLYYCLKLFGFSEQFQKAKLFHEFTHILDYINLSKCYNGENLAKILSIYSEYHASQIELACNVGFRNIHTFYKINLDKTYVETETGRLKIENDYLKPMADALIIIEKPSDVYLDLPCDKYFYQFKKFEANTMYYLGKQNFCSTFSLKRIPSITRKSYGDFYPCINNIENCIKNKDFDKLPSLEKSLFSEFYNKFKNNDFEPLIAEFPDKYF